MQQQQKTCVLLGFAPLLFKALKKSNCIFFHKTEVALSLIDSILDPQASYPPHPQSIQFYDDGRTRCLHKQLILNEGLSTHGHVIHKYIYLT